ncbi:AarF/ABC1/UbiB kinase family protein [Nocardia sp. NBC_01503]|uniref:ABC1 kinase family protein n=1 Tax=Nocardia sp. NBC_01503 TaxID=2975997 RepID=UPI002E7AB567|nr:AarF/ABC1/UbiB kinase family protein [Nocardia sp. NBC_01503]WTL31968.1 AarF/ABC1/UbiB kinase family protein [Nocardia sp. NBC_01503]
MTVRRIGGADSGGNPPARRAVRNARLAALPIAFAGRRAAGLGKRALGRPASEVNLEIQRRTAQHFFEVLGELKGFAAKLGQILALYELGLSPELAEPYRIALSRLQDATPSMLPSTVHAVLAESLGPDWRAEFQCFEDRRAASATIGQVHRAVWRDGRTVAVKVMYPGAREAIRSDLEQVRRMSGLASVFVPNADIRALTEQLSECVTAELDFAAEARQQQVFATAFADDPDFRVPEVVAQRGDVIVSEWLDGIPLTRLIATGAQSERDRVGMLTLRFVLSAPERSGLLYCDPHPGNFRMLPDGRLGVVDFGACVPWPPPEFPLLVHDVADALFNGAPADLDNAMRRHGFADFETPFDVHALTEQLLPYTDLLRHDTFRADSIWLRKRVRAAMNPRLSNVNRQLTMPAFYTPFARSILTLLGLICQLGTTGPLRAEMLRWSPELAEVVQRHRAHTGGPADLTAARTRRAATAKRDAAAG